ncbi:hypothetical protein DB30_03830 [Enhygromyxa salina]|uniref:Ricin B lectin domain-containing protein n=1 Tax=Enhygromyxa salina TaxID=215803 RepID=A0A0C1ZP32_9BACT|nr:ricin-type beta-trefoil lectin domain protein [Enhygromyxa salina]KIG19274.1 hypothetical protein DB30_03830 [Enhygromyxa salina]
MSKQVITRTLCTFAVPLVLATGCGDTTNSDGDEAAVANDHITVTKLEITSADDPQLLHPLRVAINAELSGEAYATDLLIGMRTSDGAAGCVLGAMPVEHTSDPEQLEGVDSPTAYANEAEFMVDRECYELAGRDDVELFASFDPWNRIGDRVIDASNPTGYDIYSVVAAAAVSLEGCETCETQYSLHDNPGLDAQLRELNLSSVVAVVPVAAPDGEAPALVNRPDFSVTSRSRITGLADGKALDEGQVHIAHHIRPLGSTDAGLPLIQRKNDEPSTLANVEVPSNGDLTVSSALYLEDAAREAIVNGAWSNIEEFELVTCLETQFDQAVYPGELEPRANDCAAVPVVIVRQVVGEDGLPVSQPGAASARSAEVWGDSWGANSSYGFGYSGLSFETWLDVNGSDGAATTYKGIEIHSAGSWFEAGVYSEGTVFDNSVDVLDIYATFIGYDFGGGGVAMGASIFTYEFIPEFEIQLSDGDPVSLQDIFDAASLDIDPTLTKSVSLVGVNFDDGCGSVSAGLWLEGTVGIDTEQTTITASTTRQGVEVEGTITPFMDIAAKAGTTVNYSEYVSGGIIATLNLLELDVPFTVGVEVIDYSPLSAVRLVFNEYASAFLTTLSGDITFSINYTIPWPICWANCSGDHTHTIASWNGYSTTIDFFDLTQIVNVGDDKPSGTWCTGSTQELFAGDFNGDSATDYLCHGTDNGKKWIDFQSGGAFGGTDWVRSANWCLDSSGELLVGDFNGDGRDDMLCHGSSTKWIDYADANGEFWGTDWSAASTWCTGSNAVLYTDDYDGDGRDDLYCYNKVSDTKYLDYADANGQFGGTDWTGPTTTNAKIKAAWNNNLCLNVIGNNSSSNGQSVNLYNCNSVAESFDIYFPRDGQIRATWNDGMCLNAVGNNSSTNGVDVNMYDCDSVSESWVFDPNDNKIHAEWNPNMCLNIVGNNTMNNGANANLYNCADVTETWIIVPQ